MARTARAGAARRGALLALALLAFAAATQPAAAQIGALPVPPAKAAAAPPPRAAPSPAPAAPSSGAAAPSSDPDKVFRIGGLLPLSGNKGAAGRALQAGVEMAVRDVAPQRLPGYKVETLWEDTQCGDVPALRAAAKLARANVDVMIGDVCSAASLAALSVANKFQVPLVSPASTSTALSTAGDYFFRTVPSDRYQGRYAALKMGEVGIKTALVAYAESSYGQSLAFSFVAAFTRDGGKAYPLQLGRSGNNTGAVVAELMRVKPDGIYIASNDVAQMAEVIKAVRSTKLPVKIFGGDSMMDAAVATAAGANATLGVRGSDVSFGSPEFQAAFKEFTAGKNISYISKAAHAYDAAVALMEAFRRAPEPKDGPEILAELGSVKFNGKSGPIEFDEYGDLNYDPVSSYDVTEFDKDGQIRVLETSRRR